MLKQSTQYRFRHTRYRVIQHQVASPHRKAVVYVVSSANTSVLGRAQEITCRMHCASVSLRYSLARTPPYLQFLQEFIAFCVLRLGSALAPYGLCTTCYLLLESSRCNIFLLTPMLSQPCERAPNALPCALFLCFGIWRTPEKWLCNLD